MVPGRPTHIICHAGSRGMLLVAAAVAPCDAYFIVHYIMVGHDRAYFDYLHISFFDFFAFAIPTKLLNVLLRYRSVYRYGSTTRRAVRFAVCRLPGRIAMHWLARCW